VVAGGDGVVVSGTGTATDPYVVDMVPTGVNLAVEDEGVTVRSGVVTINFVGGGVTATPGDTGEVTVTVPESSGGGGGGDTHVIGEVIMWFGAKIDIPYGWLPLDGSTFDGGLYPDLAVHLGGTTLPNFTDRFPICSGTKAAGSTGGADTHTHPLDEANARALIAQYAGGVIASRRFSGASYTTNMAWNPAGATGTTGTQTFATAVTGNTENASEGLPPWIALWFIIRAI
jgi:hypothetical protein